MSRPPQESIRRAQDTIRMLHAELEQTNREVMALTLELEQRVDALRVEVAERRKAEGERQAQVERLNLLHQITRAIGQRQDLHSIFQVVTRRLEDSLPLDFACVCLHEPAQPLWTVACVGVRSSALAIGLAMPERAHLQIDPNELARCLQGELVCDPETAHVPDPFHRRLADAGLHTLVMAPLRVESAVFGVLVAARCQADSFNSNDCEFLRQLSEHVALATQQAQLYGALQQAYDDLRQTQQTVMQQERLRALGQMASGIAHDINNAISPVALYTESLLEREPGLTDRARSYLVVIQRAIDDVAGTVARLREFYRPREQQVVLTRVELNRVVEHVVNLTRARWSDLPQQRGIVINLRTELAADLPDIMGAEGEIRDALTNLIFNGVDAMPEGGPLTVRTRLIAADPGASGVNSADRVQIEVTDTGVGMDEVTRRRCLEPFYTTKGERGTGLGLSMVYGMIERHSAELEIESAPSRGTTVRLTFLATSAVSAPAFSSGIPRAPQPPLTILLVDDDPLLITSLRDVLEEDGHRVTVADGGQRGIDTFVTAHQSGQPFAVVITDLGMPYVEGRQVAASVKAISPATPVVLLTGWGAKFLAQNEIPPHVDRVLCKPPRVADIRAVLAEVIADASEHADHSAQRRIP
jgi:signal transduction histidine kinase/ActR/RegA family two-component response regulator